MTTDLTAIAGIEVPTGLLIGGQWSSGRAGTLPVVNPATEDVLTEVADASPEDALEAVGAAAEALPGWSATPPRERAECLRRAFELMTERSEQLARLMVLENGKALRDARGEIRYAAEFFRWYAEEAVRIDGSLTIAPSGANRIMVQRQPVGVSYLITPWNFPAAMSSRKIGPALADGCTVIFKPAEDTPLTALAMAGLLTEAGCPRRRQRGADEQARPADRRPCIADPRIRKLSFTGSTEIGRLLLSQAADDVLNCSMELGGNAPFLVFDDADLDAAVEGALIAKMRNGGEACTSANRFYVHESVAAHFLRQARREASRASRRARVLRTGWTLARWSTPIRGLRCPRWLIRRLATGQRCSPAARAPDRAGFFDEPTVLDSVPADAAILSEEIFGPVAPIVRFSDQEEAIAARPTAPSMASFPICTPVTCAAALQVAEALEAGMVGINRGVVSDPAAPFGGVKQSGLGREGEPRRAA